jgi:2-dehydro-3-deoxyphosphooctonate aldolase (KDO 8-P synthase)
MKPERPVSVGSARIDGSKLAVIAGPCVVEDHGMVVEVATELKRLTGNHGLPFVFKSSYAKDNRTSVRSYRGPGREKGLDILADVREKLQVPVISDVHGPRDVADAADRLDAIQIPAFLCRQTSLLEAAGASGKPVNIKKGQFLAPVDMGQAVEKVRGAGGDAVLLTERGTSFGYHNLVVDMRSIPILARTGCPVVYDATHSLQLPGGGEVTGGEREFALPLARAALAAGAHAIFFETHPDPDEALSDPATQLPLGAVADFLRSLVGVWIGVNDGDD